MPRRADSDPAVDGIKRLPFPILHGRAPGLHIGLQLLHFFGIAPFFLRDAFGREIPDLPIQGIRIDRRAFPAGDHPFPIHKDIGNKAAQRPVDQCFRRIRARGDAGFVFDLVQVHDPTDFAALTVPMRNTCAGVSAGVPARSKPETRER